MYFQKTRFAKYVLPKNKIGCICTFKNKTCLIYTKKQDWLNMYFQKTRLAKYVLPNNKIC